MVCEWPSFKISHEIMISRKAMAAQSPSFVRTLRLNKSSGINKLSDFISGNQIIDVRLINDESEPNWENNF